MVAAAFRLRNIMLPNTSRFWQTILPIVGQPLKPGAIDGHPFGVKAIELSTTAHLAAPEGHPIIARGFTPWKGKREKTRALKGRPIMCVYPSNPHKEENRKILYH